MQIKEYMSDDVITANLRDGLYQTWERMSERGIRHMPVLNDAHKLVGIITERDLRRPDFVDVGENIARPFVLDNTHTVKEAMTSAPTTVLETDPIEAALPALVDKRFGALPVVDAEGKLVGLLSAVDALRAFRDTLQS